ncbi:hypothetical protein GE09DRAFT_1061656 [Coniochaeta sp. 2T2.1]|nr:hypothetical protein GE09DRAFT_1061656 [Coniochaeta sp. 2T2.1]
MSPSRTSNLQIAAKNRQDDGSLSATPAATGPQPRSRPSRARRPPGSYDDIAAFQSYNFSGDERPSPNKRQALAPVGGSDLNRARSVTQPAATPKRAGGQEAEEPTTALTKTPSSTDAIPGKAAKRPRLEDEEADAADTEDDAYETSSTDSGDSSNAGSSAFPADTDEDIREYTDEDDQEFNDVYANVQATVATLKELTLKYQPSANVDEIDGGNQSGSAKDEDLDDRGLPSGMEIPDSDDEEDPSEDDAYDAADLHEDDMSFDEDDKNDRLTRFRRRISAMVTTLQGYTNRATMRDFAKIPPIDGILPARPYQAGDKTRTVYPSDDKAYDARLYIGSSWGQQGVRSRHRVHRYHGHITNKTPTTSLLYQFMRQFGVVPTFVAFLVVPSAESAQDFSVVVEGLYMAFYNVVQFDSINDFNGPGVEQLVQEMRQAAGDLPDLNIHGLNGAWSIRQGVQPSVASIKKLEEKQALKNGCANPACLAPEDDPSAGIPVPIPRAGKCAVQGEAPRPHPARDKESYKTIRGWMILLLCQG